MSTDAVSLPSDGQRNHELLSQYPHLRKPGLQPCNQIAGTLESQVHRMLMSEKKKTERNLRR